MTEEDVQWTMINYIGEWAVTCMSSTATCLPHWTVPCCDMSLGVTGQVEETGLVDPTWAADTPLFSANSMKTNQLLLTLLCLSKQALSLSSHSPPDPLAYPKYSVSLSGWDHAINNQTATAILNTSESHHHAISILNHNSSPHVKISLFLSFFFFFVELTLTSLKRLIKMNHWGIPSCEQPLVKHSYVHSHPSLYLPPRTNRLETLKLPSLTSQAQKPTIWNGRVSERKSNRKASKTAWS